MAYAADNGLSTTLCGILKDLTPKVRTFRPEGAQAQLVTVDIGENVGARAQALADAVEEHVRRLDHGRRHRLMAGFGENPHQRLRLALQRFELLCSFCGHFGSV